MWRSVKFLTPITRHRSWCGVPLACSTLSGDDRLHGAPGAWESGGSEEHRATMDHGEHDPGEAGQRDGKSFGAGGRHQVFDRQDDGRFELLSTWYCSPQIRPHSAASASPLSAPDSFARLPGMPRSPGTDTGARRCPRHVAGSTDGSTNVAGRSGAERRTPTSCSISLLRLQNAMLFDGDMVVRR